MKWQGWKDIINTESQIDSEKPPKKIRDFIEERNKRSRTGNVLKPKIESQKESKDPALTP